jgi:very-short-patch-repair endonuclease
VVAVRQKGRTAEQILADLATNSHGVVRRAELLRAGISAGEIKQRLANGSLLRVHHGVYRVGHRARSVEADYLAAVKACGEGAVLAGRAAAHLWELIKGSPPPPEVLAPTQRRVDGVVVRRARRTEIGVTVIRRGIPVTPVPRTLVDLASQLPQQALARACHEAEVLHDITPREVEQTLANLPNARGRATLRRILWGEVRVTLSKLESGFLSRLREAHLPLPNTNRPAGGRRVDCRWPDRRLTVELDGYRYHHSRHAWEQDRLREREARARGDEFRRYSYSDVFENPTFMLAGLRSLLG